MKDKFKVFGIIATVAVIAFSMAACELDPGDDGVAKTLVITGIPDNEPVTNAVLKDKQITVAICDSSNKGAPKIVALNQANSASPVTIPLLSGNENKKGGSYTGTGDYYIFLFFDTSSTPNDFSDDITYVYGGGGKNPVKYAIKKGVETSTIDWSKFYKVD